MQRFQTLLLREWMQHRNGWMVILGLPFVGFIVAAVFGAIHVDLDIDAGATSEKVPLLLALGSMGGLAILTTVLAMGAALIQSPGLARRDAQDRSIEFWTSLPIPHAQSLGATLLAHLVLLPWAAIAVGVAGGWLVSIVAVGRVFGLGEWISLPWGALLPAVMALALRVAFGLLLALLWLSPLILGTMAASAWLKRCGVPAVAGALGLGGLVLAKAYDNPIVFEVLGLLGRNAGLAIIAPRSDENIVIENGHQVADLLAVIPGWALQDAGRALAALAQPAFFAAVAVGAGAFALLWLRRSRGA